MAYHGAGRRKNTDDIPGYSISEDKSLLNVPKEQALKAPMSQPINIGECKHRLPLGTCSTCKVLEMRGNIPEWTLYYSSR